MIVFQGERIVRYKKQGAGMTQPISVIAKSLVRERAR
ncbi:transcriptional regulator, partial [Klebsiella pneumoniae]